MAKGRRQDKGRTGKSQPGQVRIIAGNWRGSRLQVPDLPGLRPTGDRARETLFNWLMPVIPGARCLDLFAGTGALGLEAASRGAARVVLVESDRQAADSIQANVDRLAGQGISVLCAEALGWLPRCDEQFDIVFVDPPFDAGLQGPALTALLAAGVLADRARVYVESAADQHWSVPAGLLGEREKSLGQVRMQLLRLHDDAQSQRA